MRIALLEDEPAALARLEAALRRAEPAADVVARLHRVETAVAWLRAHAAPDLLFSDVQLADGLAFQVFDQVEVACPVVFVTAYDADLLEAFRHNGVEYLLKPVSDEGLARSLEKYRALRPHFSQNLGAFLREQRGHRRRVLVRRGGQVEAVPVERIAYFRADRKRVVLVERDGRESPIERSLSELQQELDPDRFFRASRSHLVELSAVVRLQSYPKGRLLVELRPAPPGEVVVSAEAAPAFRAWLDR